jgi:hypothetical protein
MTESHLVEALLRSILRRASYSLDTPLTRSALLDLIRNNIFTAYDCASITQHPLNETFFVIRDCLDKGYLTEINPYRARNGISAIPTGPPPPR